MFSKDNMRVWEALDRLEVHTEESRVDILSQISTFRSEISHALTALKRDLEKSTSAVPPMKGSASTSPAMLHESDYNDRISLTSILANSRSQASDAEAALTILNSLAFDRMRYRHATILEAHPKTFEWAFQNQLQSWLRSSHPVFWITGKPGSGKSTLMKYLVNNPRTPLALETWSHSRRLIVAD